MERRREACASSGAGWARASALRAEAIQHTMRRSLTAREHRHSLASYTRFPFPTLHSSHRVLRFAV